MKRQIDLPGADIREGLRFLLMLVEADIESSDSDELPRWTKRERRNIGEALKWLDRVSLRANRGLR